jgi:acyl carrier protein
MLQTFLSNHPNDVRYGSTGTPVPGYELKIVDESGGELPTGKIGELVVRGPTAAEGYWNQRAKSRRTFVGEWTYTGDKYVRDQDGYYFYCGRTDDTFKVHGMWVSPFEVEAALVSHEAVLEAAVIGKVDDDGLMKPIAFIMLKRGYSANGPLLETIRLHVKQRVEPWKCPHWIVSRPDLPRTATGKIQRFKLREELSSEDGVALSDLALNRGAPLDARSLSAAASGLEQSLAGLSAGERERFLLDLVCSTTASVLSASLESVERERPLQELGLDSLMAVELRNLLGTGLGLRRSLPATLVFDYPSVSDLADYLAREVFGLETAASSRGGAPVAEKGALDRIEELSDEEVERLLSPKGVGGA